MRPELFDELLESLREAAAIMRGEKKPSRCFCKAPCKATVNGKPCTPRMWYMPTRRDAARGSGQTNDQGWY